MEKYIGKQGTNAVKIPAFEVPSPIAAVSSRLASVQLSESMPWLSSTGQLCGGEGAASV